MAEPYELVASSMVFGDSGSGKSYWAFYNAIAKAKAHHVIYVDYTGNTYRDFHKKLPGFEELYIRGGWDANRRKFLLLLADKHMVIWHPRKDEDIQAMANYFWDLKEREYENMDEIWIYLDEVDQTADRKAPVEFLFLKARGCGIRCVGISQRPGAVSNRNIVEQAVGAVVVFNVGTDEAFDVLPDYGLHMSQEDYDYIKEFHSYKAVVFDKTKHQWVRL